MNPTPPNRLPRVILYATLTIVAIQVILAIAIIKMSASLEQAGQFGDVFGAVNALFSGLAFAGLIYTALLQREELSLQRQELAMTRKELARTAAAQEQSEIALRAQAEAADQSARLSATNYLLEHYKSELAQFQGHAISTSDPRYGRLQDLRQRERALVQMLDTLFEKLSKPQ